MKKIVQLFSSIFAVMIISLVLLFIELTPAGSDKSLKRLLITNGETASKIGGDLQKNGIIKSAIAFRIYSQVTQSAKNIKSGSYDLPSNLWVPEVINRLLAGPIEVWVTIPEGVRHEEIAQKIIQSLNLNSKDSQNFYDKFLKLVDGKEGYLFPDTYLFAKDATPSETVKVIESNFNKRVNFKVTSDQIILASILERETKTDDERPIVAGILLKRINSGWMLNIDATIQYLRDTNNGKGVSFQFKFWQPLTVNDLKIDSPFNTYLNTGLPPSPISNPGLSSIKAAVNPVDSPYWYYLHDKNGKIH